MHRRTLRALMTLFGASIGVVGCGDDQSSADGAATTEAESGGTTVGTGSGGSSTTTDGATTAGSTGGATTGGTTDTDTTTGGNAAPTATDDAFSTDEDTPLTVVADGVLSNDIDPDGDPLTVSAFDMISAAGGGVMVAVDGGFSYFPPPDFNGPDSFGYTADDGQGRTATATVAITVGPLNDDPVAFDDNYLVADDATPLPVFANSGVLVNDTDVDMDTLTATFDGATMAGGTPFGNVDGSFLYTPPSPFWGEDRFGYTVDDGSGGMDTARVRVVVSPTAVGLSAVSGGFGGFSLDGEAADDRAGSSVAVAGDVNGDGLADVIVGVAEADPGGLLAAGRSYVVFGKGDTAGVALSDITAGIGGFAINGEAQGDRSGRTVSGAGDVNGDGLADVIVGAPGADPALLSGAGRSYVVFGKTNTNPVSLIDIRAGLGGFVMDGDDAGGQSGRSVSAAGDVNGDGLADLLVGAWNHGPGSEGRAYVVFGKTDTAAVALSDISAGVGGFALAGESAGYSTAYTVASAGDVNGDGLSDLLISAGGADVGGLMDRGRVYVVFGKTDTATVALADVGAGIGGFVADGVNAGDQVGSAIAALGDVNADGLSDIAIGARRTSTAEFRAGRTYVVFGKTDTAAVVLSDVTAGIGGFAIDGESASDESGDAVAAGGDVNGDGLPDIIVGVFRAAPNGESSAGRSYVVYGKLDTAPVLLSEVAAGVGGFALDGEVAADRSGAAVGVGGDIDGDGLADLIVGARTASPGGVSLAGRIYVVFGGNFTAAVTHPGSPAADAVFGTAADEVLVAGTGDDVLVGGGGLDVLYCGPQDDVVSVPIPGFFRIDGGTGTDTLALEGAGAILNLAIAPDEAIEGIEIIDLTGNGNNGLVLGARDLAWISDTSNTLTVVGDVGDAILADLTGGSFTNNGSMGGFTEYSDGVLTLRVDDDLTAQIML